MSKYLENKDWNIGDIEIYIEITEQGRMQLGINPGRNILEEKFPIDTRKQAILSIHDIYEWKRYERNILAKREEWIRENIPTGRYSFKLELNSEMLKLDTKKKPLDK